VKLATTRAVLGAALLAASAAPSMALTFNTSWDPSITSLANAGTVEQAFTTAESRLSAILANPVTVNVNVSWGKLGTQALPTGALGASSTSLYGYFTYSQMKSWLTAAATTAADKAAITTLPATSPTGSVQYVLTAAQAKALGLVAPTGTSVDGSVGFASNNYTFSEANGTAANTYDFIAVAEHELTEVLGRMSGLSSSTPSFGTALDLFRFSSPGVRTFSYTGTGYFSINNGTTDLANFNHLTGNGDRGDWYSNTGGYNDVADAYTYSGVTGVLSSVDQTALDVIGWGSTGTGTGAGAILSTQVGLASTDVPEPASLTLLGAGVLAAVGLRRRFKR